MDLLLAYLYVLIYSLNRFQIAFILSPLLQKGISAAGPKDFVRKLSAAKSSTGKAELFKLDGTSVACYSFLQRRKPRQAESFLEGGRC